MANLQSYAEHAATPRQSEVDAELNRLEGIADGLQNKASELIDRLLPVVRATGENKNGPIPQPVLVPMAMRLAALNTRLESVAAKLKGAIDGLEL